MTSGRNQMLWRTQRISAHVLGLLVLVHLALMVIAVQGGLTAAEILSRTQGAIGWLLFYSSFVILVSVHAPIGLKNILQEQFGWRHSTASRLSILYGLALVVLGLRACWAVFTGGQL